MNMLYSYAIEGSVVHNLNHEIAAHAPWLALFSGVQSRRTPRGPGVSLRTACSVMIAIFQVETPPLLFPV